MRKGAGRNEMLSPSLLPGSHCHACVCCGCVGQAEWLVYGQINCFYGLVSPGERCVHTHPHAACLANLPGPSRCCFSERSQALVVHCVALHRLILLGRVSECVFMCVCVCVCVCAPPGAHRAEDGQQLAGPSL